MIRGARSLFPLSRRSSISLVCVELPQTHQRVMAVRARNPISHDRPDENESVAVAMDR